MKLKFVATLALLLNVVMLCMPTSSLAQERRRTSSTTVSDNYIGAGITTSGVAAISKFSLSDDFSVRPQILFDDLDEDFNGTVVIPVTYNFTSFGSRVAPFVGVGGSTQTEQFDVGLNFTSGLDYALSNRFTASGIFNIQLFDDNDINGIFGLGFNF